MGVLIWAWFFAIISLTRRPATMNQVTIVLLRPELMKQAVIGLACPYDDGGMIELRLGGDKRRTFKVCSANPDHSTFAKPSEIQAQRRTEVPKARSALVMFVVAASDQSWGAPGGCARIGTKTQCRECCGCTEG